MVKKQLHELIEQTQPNICQMVVIKDGKEVYSDEWNGYKKDDCTHIMSATKSVFALLVGIAIKQGRIKSVDDKVLDYFPEYAVKRGERTIKEVTIRHLLTMRAPYKCKGDPWTKVCISSDWTKTSLDFLGGRKGLTDEFNYQTVCLHILSGILFKATGMLTVDYANKYLFEPIGISVHDNFYAKSAQEHKNFTIEKAPKENIWFSDPAGLGTPGYGLCLSASDMAKIGLLCLNKGFWNENEIVPFSWIEEMTKPKCVEDSRFRGMYYGYLWWIIHPESNVYAAIGNSGNVIYVNPDKNMVIAVSSYFKPTVFDRVDFIEKTFIKSSEFFDQINLIDFWDRAFSYEDESDLEDDDWKAYVPSEKLLHSVQSLSSKKSVLDYGCGTGWASIAMAKAGCKNILAVDVAEQGSKKTEFYSKTFGVANCIKTKTIDENWLEFQPNESFDAIVCSNVLDVVPTSVAQYIIANFARVVKKGALLVIGLNYYLRKERAEEKNLKLEDGTNLYVDGVLRMVSKSDEEWTAMFEKYFTVQKLEHFAWPGEEKETRRLFVLKKMCINQHKNVEKGPRKM